MTHQKPSVWRKLRVIPPILIGIVLLVWMVKGRQPPQQRAKAEPVQSVRVVTVARVTLIPTAQGYGAARPARVWRAIPQVSGRIVALHERLHNGEILAQGTELVRIDPVDYELALAQAQAELAELQVQESNTRASLQIEQRTLKLAEQEMARKQTLLNQKTISQTSLDEAERATLTVRGSVQNLLNTLDLIPTQRKLLQTKAELAQRNLQHTIIRAPFTLRVAELAVEQDQIITTGQTLFAGDGVEQVEIEAQVALSNLRRLFIGRDDIQGSLIPGGKLDLPTLAELKPVVRLDLGNTTAQWQARFVRFSDGVDPKTRTMGMVVAVDNPYQKVIPGHRPPLSKGMFLHVSVEGKPQPNRVVLPRSALRGEVVYLVTADNRLQLQPVQVLFQQGNLTVIAQGLQGGERVVVSDLIPAVAGMALNPVMDEALSKQLLGGGAP
ncbi:efflux transporter, RND family, MFP subunit [Magnetococcus marinus MC-1]|uniref:Efflux transporter, RND family, MFP subunit n=1 Tax=Magnetococcus marinus (strain ATCC BAA-1437 / JCM 17883 / MC-1) TaxID=156889 RepID=A0LCI4_MAGMM|nr:efflux RND transporter periplasmic adaptor subunit [Magnetococcus marinus]ABK45677.1 efflux transporter, RND family, MFP subunit [Magnetococcus marinus MC-1]